jgi:hypothetical protein
MSKKNKKQNIFERNFDESKNLDYDVQLFEIMIDNYDYIKYVDYDDEKLHYLSEELSLFNIIYYQFESYIKENDFLTSITECEIKRVNERVIGYLATSLKTLRMALITANCSFAMRITDGIYRTLLLAIALNVRDDEGIYILLETYLEKKQLFDFSDDNNEDYAKRISCNSGVIMSFELLDLKEKNLFDDDLSWTYPLFQFKDPDNFFCNIKNNKSKITLYDISRVLEMNSYDIIPNTAESFNSYSAFEHYFDAKIPIISPFDFEEDKKYSFYFNYSRHSIGDIFSSVLTMTSFIAEFFDSMDIDEKLAVKFNDISFEITESLYDLEGKIDDIKNPKISLMKDPFDAKNKNEVRNNDDMFARILNGDVEVDTDRDKEVINSYFTTYRDNFLVSNEVYGVDHIFTSSPILSESIALKYMNCFRSLLNGLRFSKDESYPSRLKFSTKDTFLDRSADNKLFLKASSKIFKSKSEDLSFLNIISSYQIMANVCNSVIIGDKFNAINEAKHLYETIVLKTALFRWDMEKSFTQNLTDDTSSYLKYQKANRENGLTSLLNSEFAKFRESEEMLNDIPFDKASENKYKAKFAQASGFDSFPSFDNFKFTEIDSIKSYETLLKYLSDEKDMNIVLTQFDRMYKQYHKLSMPFFGYDDIKDQDLVLIILELAEILIQTTLFDTIVMFLNNDNIDIAIDTVLYMIRGDIARIEVDSTSFYGISKVDFNF